MDNNQPSSAKNESIFFLKGIFDETVSLLIESHDYFSKHGHISHYPLTEQDRSVYSREMSRITIRLSSVMSWLVAQKAVAHGQISRKTAIEEYGLNCKDSCLLQDPDALHSLPDAMIRLLDISYSIYSRVNRLDEQMVQSVATAS